MSFELKAAFSLELIELVSYELKSSSIEQIESWSLELKAACSI